MPRTSAATLKCPNPEHAGSRVKLDGTYGKPGHRRQRYKCLPRGGGRPHVFTELLPREESWTCSCEHCERLIERREGPKAPRHYQFVARGIAEALQALGTGSSYMRASSVTRDRARRSRCDTDTGELRESNHGQLLADWVEVFAPIVFEPFRPTAWPTQGSLLLDHIPFRVRAFDSTGRRIPAGQVAFDVFCGVGFVAGKPKLWLSEAFTSASPANWSAFLGSLPGYPERVVCDGHTGLLAAVQARWPRAELQQCEWHLQHALDRLLAKEARSDPGGELCEVRTYAENALAGPSSWQRFVRAARMIENESPDRWIAVNQVTIESQFARRALSPYRAPDMPLTTAALDQITRPIIAALYPRRYALKNRERLNRLLMLLQLHINGDDDTQEYTRTIRIHLEGNGGRPLTQRRAVTDPANSPSLR
jgi:hypothetical protein